jgi:6,7-dimethyl-8-ribityllumazine synthase
MKYGIIVSEFNSEITEPLLEECLRGFKEQGIRPEVVRVPGAWEIPLAAKKYILAKEPQAVVALGAVIKGETDHFRQVCDSSARGLMQVQIETGVPIVFEVLMADTVKKARARTTKGYSAAKVATTLQKLYLKL